MTARRTARQIDDRIDEVIQELEPGQTLSLLEMQRRTGLTRQLLAGSLNSALEKLRNSALRDWVND